MNARTIVEARTKPWTGLAPEIDYGVECTLSDGMIVGMGIGTENQARDVATAAVGKSEDYIDAIFAIGGVTNRPRP